MTFTHSDYKTVQVSVHERSLQVPAGFTAGTIITRPGRNYVHVTRNRDDKTVLCPLTPASDEVMSMSEMREALHEAMDSTNEA